jgi:menaquinol-cytochrome c reductase iron-sulfur subunit
MTEPVSLSSLATGEPTRRSFLYKAFTATIGAVVGIFPLAAGVLFFLDPLRKRKLVGEKSEGREGFIKVGSLESVPKDGSPTRFPVIVARREDAWTTYLNVPIGAVYVRRDPKKDEIVAFNVTCPHLGCAVDYIPGNKEYLCPCHDSAFAIDGKRTNQTPPRDLDTLEVDTEKLKIGEIWVKYQDFRTGEEHKIMKT